MALDGDTALVGACDTTVAGLEDAGAAYVFTGAGASWSEQTELTASDVAGDDQFGTSVALDGDTALIGAPDKTVSGQDSAGAAYVFTGAGASWSQQAELSAPDPAACDVFGYSVASPATRLWSVPLTSRPAARSTLGPPMSTRVRKGAGLRRPS